MPTNTLATSDGGGAVALDSTFSDGFSGPSLNSSLWASGTWAGGSYTPSFSSGAIQISEHQRRLHPLAGHLHHPGAGG